MRGAIYAEDAYAQGKMLDHSSWGRGEWIMPRKITPSDVDMAIDNKGKILYCELSSSETEWKELSRGQRLLYEGCIYGSAGLAVLLHHNVPVERQIDTRKDVISFQVMTYCQGNKFRPGFNCTPVYDGEKWESLVESWFRNWRKTRTKCLEDANDGSPVKA